MKTTKITLITALIALGAILFGQTGQVEFIKTGYIEKSSKFENMLNNLLCMNDGSARDRYHEPVVYKTYIVDEADIVYEEDYKIEAWMLSPFECGLTEPDLLIEKWMTSPFESSVAEADIAIEKWMTIPFEAADYIEIESWMTSAF